MEQTRTAPRSAPPPALATVGGALTVVSGGVVYHVVGPVEIAAQIPVTTTTVPSPDTTAPAAPEEPAGPSDNSGLVTLLGVAIFVGAVVTILIKGKKQAVR
jgi:hypothetical protein